MNRNKLILPSLVWLSPVSGMAGHVAEMQQTSKPNFVLFIADDCTCSDLGCYGGGNVKTPAIDRLASEGVRFTRCFQSAPMCSPTRHNLLTGMYPVKTGAYPNHSFVSEGTPSVVQYLKPSGYRVALAGKSHIAPREIFDFEYLGDGKTLDFEMVDRFLEDVSKGEDPFCLFLCSHEPHTPWTKGDPKQFNPDSVVLPPFWVDTRETREAYCRYLAEIGYLDGEVEQAVKLLEKYGVENETVFIFTSEQGNSFPFAKWTCYYSGLHTALIVRYPGKIEPGTLSDCLTDYCDVVPTFLDMAGLEIPDRLDGVSLKDVLLHKKSSPKKYSFGMQTTRGIIRGSDFFGIRSVTDGRYRLIVNLTPEAVFQNTITAGRSSWWLSWIRQAETDPEAKKLVWNYRHRPPMELYDDLKDPYNQCNLADSPELGEIKKELEKALSDWMASCGDKGQQTELDALEHILRSSETD